MERHEADEQLRRAIADHADAYDLLGEGELMTDFVVVAAWLMPDLDGERRTAYTTHLPEGWLPNHVALGLFQVGCRHFYESADDE